MVAALASVASETYSAQLAVRNRLLADGGDYLSALELFLQVTVVGYIRS